LTSNVDPGAGKYISGPGFPGVASYGNNGNQGDSFYANDLR
jgi:hypothetical protein